MSSFSFIPVNEPLLNGNEKRYLSECIDSGWISSEGPFVKQFEKKMAATVGRKYGVAVTNGTAALDAAFEAIGISAGDEVILPAFTIISCIGQIVRAGAKPVIVDSDPNTWNIDVSKIEEKITKNTKAILIVHIYGLPVDMDPVLDLAKKYGLRVIEDAAEMLGQQYKGKPCGSFGDLSTFSFYPNKHVTTGEGGMILSNDAELSEACKSLRNLCFTAKERFVHEQLGWNLRMTNMQAAVGVAQLEQLNHFVKLKRQMGNHYNELFKELDHVQLPLKSTIYAENIYWVYGIVLKPTSQKNAKNIMSELGKRGIGTRPFFCPLNQQPVLKKLGLFEKEEYPVADNLYQQGFYIPSGLNLSNSQIIHVANTVIEVINA